MGVGKNVCLTVLLFDGLSVYPFVCNNIIVCMFLSVCLPVRNLSVYVSVRPFVRPTVRPSACMHIFVILFVTPLVCIFLSVRSSVRLSVHLVAFCHYECIHVSLLSVYMFVTYLISNFLLLVLISNIYLLTNNVDVEARVRMSTYVQVHLKSDGGRVSICT